MYTNHKYHFSLTFHFNENATDDETTLIAIYFKGMNSLADNSDTKHNMSVIKLAKHI